MTVEVWFRAEPDGTGVQRLISKENGVGGEAISIAFDASGFLTGYVGGSTLDDNSADLRDGEWHHAALVSATGIGSTKLCKLQVLEERFVN